MDGHSGVECRDCGMHQTFIQVREVDARANAAALLFYLKLWVGQVCEWFKDALH